MIRKYFLLVFLLNSHGHLYASFEGNQSSFYSDYSSSMNHDESDSKKATKFIDTPQNSSVDIKKIKNFVFCLATINLAALAGFGWKLVLIEKQSKKFEKELGDRVQELEAQGKTELEGLRTELGDQKQSLEVLRTELGDQKQSLEELKSDFSKLCETLKKEKDNIENLRNNFIDLLKAVENKRNEDLKDRVELISKLIQEQYSQLLDSLFTAIASEIRDCSDALDSLSTVIASEVRDGSDADDDKQKTFKYMKVS